MRRLNYCPCRLHWYCEPCKQLKKKGCHSFVLCGPCQIFAGSSLFDPKLRAFPRCQERVYWAMIQSYCMSIPFWRLMSQHRLSLTSQREMVGPGDYHTRSLQGTRGLLDMQEVMNVVSLSPCGSHIMQLRKLKCETEKETEKETKTERNMKET